MAAPPSPLSFYLGFRSLADRRWLAAAYFDGPATTRFDEGGPGRLFGQNLEPQCQWIPIPSSTDVSGFSLQARGPRLFTDRYGRDLQLFVVGESIAYTGAPTSKCHSAFEIELVHGG